MKIVIAHLFYDLLNLYGESGNILALENELKNRDIEVEVKNISLEDELNLDKLDFIYIGSGTERSQIIALNYLKKYKKDILDAIGDGKVFLATGNSIELFGKKIVDEESKEEALDIFDYYTERTKKRIVAECTYSFDKINSKIIGFTNHQGTIKNIKTPLFEKYKENNQEIYEKEGIIKNNFFGTYLIGPLLVRNPEFLKYVTDILINSIEKIKV